MDCILQIRVPPPSLLLSPWPWRWAITGCPRGGTGAILDSKAETLPSGRHSAGSGSVRPQTPHTPLIPQGPSSAPTSGPRLRPARGSVLPAEPSLSPGRAPLCPRALSLVTGCLDPSVICGPPDPGPCLERPHRAWGLLGTGSYQLWPIPGSCSPWSGLVSPRIVHPGLWKRKHNVLFLNHLK